MGFIESGDCSFYIEGKQVVTIVYRQDPVWNLYPIDKLPADQELFLKGFRWEGARRPSQRDVFDRRIRPTLRAEKSALPHPSFPFARGPRAAQEVPLRGRTLVRPYGSGRCRHRRVDALAGL